MKKIVSAIVGLMLLSLSTSLFAATVSQAKGVDATSNPEEPISFTKEQIYFGTKVQIEQLLKQADKDNDQRISRLEYLQNAHETYIKYDTEKKGGITFEQYKQAAFDQLDEQVAMASYIAPMLASVKQVLIANQENIIQSIDIDHDGIMSYGELERDQDLSFTRLDLNSDGFIDKIDIELLKNGLGFWYWD